MGESIIGCQIVNKNSVFSGSCNVAYFSSHELYYVGMPPFQISIHFCAPFCFVILHFS